MIHKLGALNAQLTGATCSMSGSGGKEEAGKLYFDSMISHISKSTFKWVHPNRSLAQGWKIKKWQILMRRIVFSPPFQAEEIKRTEGHKGYLTYSPAVKTPMPSFTSFPLLPPFPPCFSFTALGHSGLVLSPCVCISCSFSLEFLRPTLFSLLNFKIPFKDHLLVKLPWKILPFSVPN